MERIVATGQRVILPAFAWADRVSISFLMALRSATRTSSPLPPQSPMQNGENFAPGAVVYIGRLGENPLSRQPAPDFLEY